MAQRTDRPTRAVSRKQKATRTQSRREEGRGMGMGREFDLLASGRRAPEARRTPPAPAGETLHNQDIEQNKRWRVVARYL
jgi:hypothetical protein